MPSAISSDDAPQSGSPPRESSSTTAAEPTEARLRQMMLGFDTPPSRPSTPFHQQQPFGHPEDDPFLAALQQMMSNFGAAGTGGVPQHGPQQTQQAPPSSSAAPPLHIWRVLHALSTLALVVYFALTTPFAGTKLQREHSLLSSSSSPYPTEAEAAAAAAAGTMSPADQHKFFYLFATLESVLLTSRYLVEKFSPGSRMDTRSGMLWTVAGLLPPPYSSYLETALRYKNIFDTLLADLLLMVFVLGVVTWARTA